jgi:hypothetical protein
MGPTRGTAAGKAAAGPSNTSDSGTLSPQEELAAAQAEIAQLRAQLEAQTTPPSRERSPDRIQLVTVLEAIAERLNGPQETVDRPVLSKKLADPLPLDKGIEPTFASWKTQMLDKLEVNADHFATTRSRMAYVFGRTTGDAQEHLHPRYKASATNPFTSKEEMISHLTSIYEDPFLTQNARLDYRSLMIRVSETFLAF